MSAPAATCPAAASPSWRSWRRRASAPCAALLPACRMCARCRLCCEMRGGLCGNELYMVLSGPQTEGRQRESFDLEISDIWHWPAPTLCTYFVKGMSLLGTVTGMSQPAESLACCTLCVGVCTEEDPFPPHPDHRAQSLAAPIEYSQKPSPSACLLSRHSTLP